MPRLPDVDSLGARPIPRASRRIATVRNPTAISDAIGDAGQTLDRAGEQIMEREDRLSYGAAKAQILKADAEARAALLDDPDYATAEKRYVDTMAQARANASKLITSRFDRRLFDVDTQGDVDRGLLEVRRISTGKRHAADLALGATSLEDVSASARSAPDDAAREAAIKAATDIITGLQASGAIDPVKAVDMRRQWTDNYAFGQVLNAVDSGDMEEARNRLGRYGRYLSDQNYFKLNAAIEGEGDAKAILAAADAGMGRSITGPVDVPTVVKQLFPNARITDTARDPNSPLGKANPRSYHIERAGSNARAIDIAPIKGLTFEQYTAQLRQAGVEIIEARDEVKNPSAHATGPHWHVAYRISTQAGPRTVDDAVSRAVSALGPNATAKQIEGVRAEVTKRWQLKEASENQREEDAVEGVQQALIKNGGNWYALPASLRNSVKAKYVQGLINFGEGLAPTAPKRITDPAEYVRLSEMAARRPEEFARINPIEYRGKLDDTDWERMVSQRNEIIGRGRTVEGASISEIRSVTGPMLDARGLTTDGLPTKTDRDKAARMSMAGRIAGFEKAVASDVAIWQQNNPGKKPTTRDIQEIADRRLLTAVQDDQERFQFELRPGPARVRIPAAARNRVANLMRPILGREPTEQEILQAYLREARGG